MNILHKVTLETLKKNRVRTVVTIIGIMLSAAMICAVTTFVSSTKNYLHDYLVYGNGSWHGALHEAEWTVCTDIRSDSRIENVAYGQLLGYAKVDSKNEFKPYLFVIAGDKKAFRETMPIHITSGTYPKNSGEILLPDHLKTNGGVIYHIGDTLTLELGDRVLDDGRTMGQYNPGYVSTPDGDKPNDEELVIRETRTYQVVGFYERPVFEPYTAPGYTAITLTDGTLGGAYKYDLYFRAKDAAETGTIHAEYIRKYGLGGTTNSDVLMAEGAIYYDGFSSAVYSLALIAMALILFGSVSLIYNAFSISVSERTKQFGLLSSIGATKAQMKHMVLFEALAVSAVGIPLGIGVGIGGIAVTLQLMGHRFSSIFHYDAPMRVSVSLLSVVVACVVALVTVLISAWLPSRRAMKVSAVEAIRQQQDIRASKKPVKTSKLTYFFFGLPGVIATKHYKRNRKKYRSTVASLFMSIVLFVSTSAFTDALLQSVRMGSAGGSFDLRIAATDGALENSVVASRNELTAQIAALKSVDHAACAEGFGIYMTVETKYLTPSVVNTLNDLNTGEPVGDKREASVRVKAVFVNDEAFRALLRENKLDESKYMNPEAPLAVAVDVSVVFDRAAGKHIQLNLLKTHNATLNAEYAREIEGYYYHGIQKGPDGTWMHLYVGKENGEELFLTEEEAVRHLTMEVGHTIKEMPYFVTNGEMLTVIYPESHFDAVMQDTQDPDFGTPYVYVLADNHAKAESEIQNLLIELDFHVGVYNAAAVAEEERNIVVILRVFVYGFTALLSLIAAANIFNTISTNVHLRRREFAMLKSVGMTAGGFRRMMCFECLLYGSRALLFGLPVSGVISYLIWLSASDGFEYPFTLPWEAMGTSALCVFTVVFVTMLYAMGKIRQANPIDALKNENL